MLLRCDARSIEARFTEGGPWVAAATGVDTLEFERGASFAEYEKAVTKLPPDCISALRRMLQVISLSLSLSRPHPLAVQEEWR